MARGPLTEDQRDQMRRATSNMALALVDDLDHIRSIAWKKMVTPGDIRRLSSLLRRILVNEELSKVAAPRLGRVHVLAPDFRIFHRENEKIPFQLVVAEDATIKGVRFAAFVIDSNNDRNIPSINADERVLLRVDAFLKQRVICYNGNWINRAELIKFIANIGSGVHTSEPEEPVDELINEARKSIMLDFNGDIPRLAFRSWIGDENMDIIMDGRKSFDIANFMLIGAAQHLTSSPQIVELEGIISSTG